MMHAVVIIGRVGQRPEMRYTPQGKAVINFSVAVNEKYTSGNGEITKRTTWYRIAAFERLAETCYQYLDKGMLVYVRGKLTSDPATGGPCIRTAQDGTPRASFDVNASQVIFLSRTGQANDNGSEEIEF